MKITFLEGSSIEEPSMLSSAHRWAHQAAVRTVHSFAHCREQKRNNEVLPSLKMLSYVLAFWEMVH